MTTKPETPNDDHFGTREEMIERYKAMKAEWSARDEECKTLDDKLATAKGSLIAAQKEVTEAKAETKLHRGLRQLGWSELQCPVCDAVLGGKMSEEAKAIGVRLEKTEQALRDAKPVAWKLVPLEATDEMIDAAQACDQEGQDDVMLAWRHLYKIMIDAAPLYAAPTAVQQPVANEAYLTGSCTEHECRLCRLPYYARKPGMHHSGIPSNPEQHYENAEAQAEDVAAFNAAPQQSEPVREAIKPTHEAADAFWKYWRENGETHKHGYYESTWGAINAAIRTAGFATDKSEPVREALMELYRQVKRGNEEGTKHWGQEPIFVGEIAAIDAALPLDAIQTDGQGEDYWAWKKSGDKARQEALKKQDCPHAAPFRYCPECVVNPCPIGLGAAPQQSEPCAICGKPLSLCTAEAQQSEPVREALDTKRLDAIAQNYWKLDPYDRPTGGGDADVGWRVTAYYQSKPNERVVAELDEDDPRKAIDAAIALPLDAIQTDQRPCVAMLNGHTECGYPEAEAIHEGSSLPAPPLGRHKYTPAIQTEGKDEDYWAWKKSGDKARQEALKKQDCPHAAPFRYCPECVVNPCPIGLGAAAQQSEPVREADKDGDRLNWLETQYTLHKSAEFIYVVDGYEIMIMEEGNQTTYNVYHGSTLRGAIDAAIRALPLDAIQGEKNE